jgi:hypothetical protein
MERRLLDKEEMLAVRVPGNPSGWLVSRFSPAPFYLSVLPFQAAHYISA